MRIKARILRRLHRWAKGKSVADCHQHVRRKEEKELEVIVHGKIDLRKVPKEIFDAFIAALEEDICNVAEKERNNENIS